MLMLLSIGAISVAAQATPAYKITDIKIVPFSEQTGMWEDAISATEPRSFFNEIGTGLFVTIEISGKDGSFATGRKVEVTVMEGKKLKVKKLEQVGLIGSEGKYYYPLYLPSAMCSQVTISARLLGQKTVTKAVVRKIEFQCGE
jgi:hypothetical protein